MLLRLAFLALLAITFCSFPSCEAAMQTAFMNVSTVPGNGDVNPYGVFVVPETHGKLIEGDILVSNFNNMANQQGTGTTIVQFPPDGSQQKLFAQISASQLGDRCPGGVGLTTALVVLKNGWVIVGSLPTLNGTSVTAMPGCLIVLDCNGNVVETFHNPDINGPWDMTVVDFGDHAVLFVTNVLNGDVAQKGFTTVVNRGTVLRIELRVPSCNGAYYSQNQNPIIVGQTVIGSGFGQRSDPAALIIGPTGVAFCNGTLYVADTLYNRIAAIPHALERGTDALSGLDVTANGLLNGPLGMTVNPSNCNIFTANSGDGNVVITAPDGNQDPNPLVLIPGNATAAGDLFGLALKNNFLYWVNDGTNTINALQLLL